MNPEVFDVSPRRGRRVVTQPLQPRDVEQELPDDFEPKYTSSKLDQAPDPESGNMLAITISCVMLMAAQLDNISDEYLSVVESYLGSVKDEHGAPPPNVGGILKQVKYLREERKYRNDEFEDAIEC